jgi:hypothetical protein
VDLVASRGLGSHGARRRAIPAQRRCAAEEGHDPCVTPGQGRITTGMKKTLSILGFVALAGCSMISKGKAGSADLDTGGADDAPKALADNMHDAPTFHVGDSLSGDAACHASGYMKIDAPAGQPLHIDVGVSGPSGVCLDVSYLTSTGGSQNGGQMFGDVCENKTLDVTGLDGGSYLQISESGACQGAKFSIALH